MISRWIGLSGGPQVLVVTAADGYSLDGTAAPGAKTYNITCQDTSAFLAVPRYICFCKKIGRQQVGAASPSGSAKAHSLYFWKVHNDRSLIRHILLLFGRFTMSIMDQARFTMIGHLITFGHLSIRRRPTPDLGLLCDSTISVAI